MKLFYSYCHVDNDFRAAMEKHLSVLQRGGDISEWSDRKISPGQDFMDEIDRQMADADIITLLISSDFLASDACRCEMTKALNLRTEKATLVIPIIVRACDWKSSDISSLLALPDDGMPITEWNDRDKAFLNVVDGIRDAIASLEFCLRQDYSHSFTETEFISQGKTDVRLDDIFVFPNIATSDSSVRSFERMLDMGKHIAIRGDYRSGKTTLCRKLFLEQIEQKRPVLIFSGRELTTTRQHEDLVRRKFLELFKGSFSRWQTLSGKMLIVDDLDSSSSLSFLSFAKEYFDSVIITVSDDEYIAFFKDEQQLASFNILTIDSLNHGQQENLIRNWKALSDSHVSDGAIDQLEDRLNAIVLDKKIVPRFPFYVLSILQTYEAFMPQSIQITAYGHCYQALITAQIIGAGIHADDVDSVFNFLSHLACHIFCLDRRLSRDSFAQFVEKYRSDYVIKDGVLHRIKDGPKPLLQSDGDQYRFRYPYAYYFLFGYYVARHQDERDKYFDDVLKYSYVRDNTFIIIFTIHHAYDSDLIDSILERTKGALGDREIATLENDEVKMLEVALREIPESVVSGRPVDEERRIERRGRDEAESRQIERDREQDDNARHGSANDVLLSLKNMDILGQILRNKYGSLPKTKLADIVSTIVDAGLRLIGVLTDRDGIVAFEDYIAEMVEEAKPGAKSVVLDDTRRRFRAIVLFLVHIMLSRIADSVGKKELRPVIKDTVRRRGTMAYEMIGVFHALGAAEKVSEPIVNDIIRLLRRCDREHNRIAWRLVSLRTQRYLNTHQVEWRLRQRLYAELRLDYRPNFR